MKNTDFEVVGIVQLEEMKADEYFSDIEELNQRATVLQFVKKDGGEYSFKHVCGDPFYSENDGLIELLYPAPFLKLKLK